ncbi:DUF485 domain-containing protein [Pseudonocardia spirodelae]|uniref:DUF485 domain-containing protein n=1 Tax=Pseudonocardia spirodelae TaxID=3133431 RepID=A0ABU8T6I9_9PSEU
MTRPLPGGPVPAAPPVRLADAVHADPRYRALRARRNRFVAVASVVFLAWYGLFVGLSAFAPSLTATPVLGSVNLGFLLGLSQFVSTLVIVGVYRRFAARELDPFVAQLREVHGGHRGARR